MSKKVFIVQIIDEIESYYQVPRVLHCFGERHLANTWIENTQAAQRAKKEAADRAQELARAWEELNPFEFSAPPKIKKWPAGMPMAAITPELRAERDRQKQEVADRGVAFDLAYTAHHEAKNAHVAEIFAQEGRIWTPDLDTVYATVSEYEVSEMEVYDSLEAVVPESD